MSILRIRGRFRRPLDGEPWKVVSDSPLVEGWSGVPWQSNGGPGRRHPARSYPFSVEVLPSEEGLETVSVALVGVFAQHALPEFEPFGAVGAMLEVHDAKRPIARVDFIQGKHYSDALDLTRISRMLGDGSYLETAGTVVCPEATYRLDVFRVVIPQARPVSRLIFRDLGTPACFALLDVWFECQQEREESRMADPLDRLLASCRVQNGYRFLRSVSRVIAQFRSKESGLEEAKREAVACLSAVAVAMEPTERPSQDAWLLEAFRMVDRSSTLDEVWSSLAHQLVALESEFQPAPPKSGLVEKAIALIEQRFAEPLSSDAIAAQFGVSSSHLRHSFRRVTGQSLYRFLLHTRLDRARELVRRTELPIKDIAEQCGFSDLVHLSHAFRKRYGISPSSLREGQRTSR